MAGRALVICGLQIDALAGGPFCRGDPQPVVDRIIHLATSGGYDARIAIQIAYPANHITCAAHHGVQPWSVYTAPDGTAYPAFPTGLMAGTPGFLVDPRLRMDAIVRIGTQQDVPIQSGFRDQGEDLDGSPLRDALDNRNIRNVDVVGLPLEFLVTATALDAAACGYHTRVVRSASHPWRITSTDVAKAIAYLERGGVPIV